MTTECLPCSMAAALPDAAPEGDVIPQSDGKEMARWEGPIGLEGVATGDGRFIVKDALRWDSLPVPLRWVKSDVGAHDGAVVVGKIEEIERLTYEEANERLEAAGKDPMPDRFAEATIIWGSGMSDLGSEEGREAFRHVQEELTPGVSMDLDDILVEEPDEPGNMSMKILEGRVRAATQVAIPAFDGARIATSKPETFDQGEDAALALETLDDLTDETYNWVEDVGGLPGYIKRISKHLREKGMDQSRAIATAVNVAKKMCATGDVNFPGNQQVNAKSRAQACADVAEWEQKKARAHADAAETTEFGEQRGGGYPIENCQDLKDAIQAIGRSKDRAKTVAHIKSEKSRLGCPDVEIPDSFEVDGALVASAGAAWRPPRSWFENPGLGEPTGLVVEDSGRVYGHIALWGTCHIANPQGHGTCTSPPSSPSNYAYFRTGLTRTDKGDVATGKITMNTLHAGQRLGSTDAIAHYEHTGLVGADVVAGEDAHGIWVAGAARDGADLVALRAAPVSGDWRKVGGRLELVGALCVNVPGFPVPRTRALVASGAVESLVASGVVMREERHGAVLDLMDDAQVLALRARFREMDRREAAEALAARVARSAAWAKVRRLAAAVGPLDPARRFAYNPDQWRVPKGNPDAGQWVDMPGSDLAHLGDVMMDVFDRSADVDPQVADNVGTYLDKATEAAKKVDEALKAGDADQAQEMAGEANKALGDLENSLQHAVDAGGISDADAENMGAALHDAQTSNDRVRNSDLSLLGQGDIGGDAGNLPGAGDTPGGAGKGPNDVTAKGPGDVTAKPALPGVAGTEHQVGDKVQVRAGSGSNTAHSGTVAGEGDAPNTVKVNFDDGTTEDVPKGTVERPTGGGPLPQSVHDSASKLEADLQNEADKGSMSDADASKLGEKLDAYRNAVDSNDPDKANEAFADLEATAQDIADRDGFSDPEAVGKALDDAYTGLHGEGPGGPTGGGGDGGAPDGISQSAWDNLSPEERKAVSSAISGGADPQEALDAVRSGAGGPDGDVSPGRPDSGGPPGEGSLQQRWSRSTSQSASKLEQVLMDSTEGEVDPTTSDQIGQGLSAFRDAVDRLDSGVQDGNYNVQDLADAKTALTGLEATLMDAADRNEFSDEAANTIGTALDDVFSNLGALEHSLQGETAPPPFANRSYVRQWLGRKGIRLALTAGR